jgi:hypothetical protein
MVTEKIKMSLGDYIARMKAGWGFHRPYRVMRIGEALARLFPEETREKEVQVEFKKGSYGYGPNFHYTYSWYVEGISLPKEGVLSPSESDLMFGYSSRSLPYFTNLGEDSFRVGYIW